MTPSGTVGEPFASLRRDMERLFEDFSRDFGWDRPAAAGVGMAPRVDVSETDSEIKIEAELPGVDEKDVEVVLSGGRLTIKGEKKQEREEKKKDYHLVERSYGSFARSISLPFETDPDKIEATFAKGVLTITVPKGPEAQKPVQGKPTHPGDILREDVFPELNMSVTDAARELRVSRGHLHRILRGEQGITPEIAVRLGKFCGNGPEIWLALQGTFDIWQARRELGDAIDRIPSHGKGVA